MTASLRLMLAIATVLLLAGCETIEDAVIGCTPPAETDAYAFETGWVRIVQGNQTIGNLAPLLGDRPAGVEVLLVMTDGAVGATDFDIQATVDVLDEDATIGSVRMELGCVRSERSAMRGTIPAAWIRPGMQVRLALQSGDPSTVVPSETIELNPLVATVPELNVTVFPLLVGDQAPDTSRSIFQGWLDAARQRFAISAYDLEIHEPIDLDLGDACSSETKFAALRELSFLRTERASDRFFIGVLPCSAGGVAFTPGFVQVTSPGLERTDTFLHELGHNFSLLHAPCGVPPGVDPNFPYRDGVLGLPGFDASTDTWLPSDANDVMGYCTGTWLSDYNYAQAARYRMAEERPPAVTGQAGDDVSTATILVQGEVAPDGAVDVTHAVRKWEPTRREAASAADETATALIEVTNPSGKVLASRTTVLLDVDHVDVRVFTARVGMDDGPAMDASDVRVTYGHDSASRPLVDGD